MPGQPRDSYDTVVRKLAELERELEREKRHRHPTGRNIADATGGLAIGTIGQLDAFTVPTAFATVPLDTEIWTSGSAVTRSGGVFTIHETGLYMPFFHISRSGTSMQIRGMIYLTGSDNFGFDSSDSRVIGTTAPAVVLDQVGMPKPAVDGDTFTFAADTDEATPQATVWLYAGVLKVG